MAEQSITQSERSTGRIIAAMALLWLGLIVVGYAVS
jgi:hypothetical protein